MESYPTIGVQTEFQAVQFMPGFIVLSLVLGATTLRRRTA
jgi:hypothetical protein